MFTKELISQKLAIYKVHMHQYALPMAINLCMKLSKTSIKSLKEAHTFKSQLDVVPWCSIFTALDQYQKKCKALYGMRSGLETEPPFGENLNPQQTMQTIIPKHCFHNQNSQDQ